MLDSHAFGRKPRYSPLIFSIHTLRVAAQRQQGSTGGRCHEVSPECGEDIYARLAYSGYAPRSGNPSLRSEMSPVFLSNPQETACGRLEDTRFGKRLFLKSGGQLEAAHLSRFAYANIPEAVELLREVADMCWVRGYSCFFVVHRHFPGKACLILRKKYSVSLKP
ncbi:hypothetical protein J3R74_003824 [Puniceicoccus vermicola]